MIIFETPIVWKERYGPSAHLISTIPGPEGTAELLAFGAKMGLKPEWLQKPGTHREHFDIWNSKIIAALKAGATQVTRKEWCAAYRAKKLTYENETV